MLKNRNKAAYEVDGRRVSLKELPVVLTQAPRTGWTLKSATFMPDRQSMYVIFQRKLKA